MVFTILLIVCITAGLISFVVFHVQQHMFSKEPVELCEKMKWDFWSIAKETSIRSKRRAETRKRKEQSVGQAQKIFLTLKDLLWTLFEYSNILRESYVLVMLGNAGHPIWATVNILTMFLPGIEWQSYSQQKLPGNHMI